MKKTIFAAALLAGTAILPIWAQQPAPQQQDDEGYAPEHGVARISLLNGDVSVRRGDSGDLIAAALNGPLVVNDHLATGQNSRAEIQFDWGNMIRLAPDTEVRLGELEDRRYLVQIATGTATFSVLRNSGADVEISTPTVSVRPAEQGTYRITVQPDGTTEITVRAGRAEIFSPRGTETLIAGRTMEARGTPSDPEYMIRAAILQDEWDRWNTDRDRQLESTSSYRYVSPDIVGAEELDANGRWTTDPEYGNVWVPTVDPGWAPYRVGRWVDEPYYGWTWVSGDPFGWAPYHYGNWYQSSYGWAWYPGAINRRHYWRPALVGFFGWGSGSFNIGFGFGNVGWVPLAPRERFRPWYGRGYNNTTIVNNVTIINNYRNARSFNGRGNGVTSIGANDFTRGRRINSNNFVRASNNDLVRAGSVQGRLPFNGSAESRRMSDRQVNTASLPRVNENRPFASRGGGRSNDNRGREQGRQAQIIGQSPGQASAPNDRVIRGNPGNNSGNNNGTTGGFRRFEGNSTGTSPNDNRGQIDRGQRNGVVPTPGGGTIERGGNNNNGNSDGFRRFERNTPMERAPNAPQVIGGERNNQRNGFSQTGPPQTRDNFPRLEPRGRDNSPNQAAPQQPVRISPPIVRDRGLPPAGNRQEARPEAPRGGFGSPRQQSAPPIRQGGNGGGGNRGDSNRGGESRGNGGDRGGRRR